MLRRILFVIGVTLVVMLTLISIATRTVLMEGYSRLEASFMERNVERVQNTVSDELSALSRTANDWAAWDETYRFVKDLNGSYIRGNMGRDTFENLRLSTMLYLNPQGRLVFGRMFDAATGALTGAPDSFLAWLAAHPRMTSFERTDSHAESIATLGEGTFLVATRPILDSQLQGPVRGTLVFARPLDSGEVKRLSRSLKLSLSFYPLNDPRLPADGVRAMEIISAHASVSIDTRSQDIINGYAFLRDDQGTPLLLMRVEFPRDIHRQARMTARYFIAWLVVIGVVFSAVVLLMLQKTVLSRLHQLSAGVLAVGTGGGSSRRVSVSGRDQIAYLGAAINGMLDTLASSTAELRQSEQKNAAFLGAIPDLILRVSRHGRVVDVHLPPGFRPLHERWPDLVGRDITDFPGLFPAVPQSLVTEGLNAMARAMESGSPEVFDCPIPSDDGLRHYQARIAASGKEETVVLVRDVTAEKRVEEARRRDVMVKEIHHRVKNNLQVISSLLALQSSSTTDPRTRALLDQSRDRVRSMALIHEKLYQAGGGPGPAMRSTFGTSRTS